MLKRTLIVTSLILLAAAVRPVKTAFASEGSVEMRSTVGENTRCQASSHLGIDNVYTILISCRDLTYPAVAPVKYYTLWANPISGKGPVRLGNMEYGLKMFRIADPFSSLFVTTESNDSSRGPQGPIVLRGTVQPFALLERNTTPTPTPEGSPVLTGTDNQTQPKQLTTRQKLADAFKKAGLAATLALIALIGLIFVITRSRG